MQHFIFPWNLGGLFLSWIFVAFFVKHIYLNMFGEHLQIRGVKISGKYILRVKNLKVDIFTQVFPWKCFSRFLHHMQNLLSSPPFPPGINQSEITYSPSWSSICFIKRMTSLKSARYKLNWEDFYVVHSASTLYIWGTTFWNE